MELYETVSVVDHLGADDNTMAAGGALGVLLLLGVGAVRVAGSTSGTATVELDALTGTGDAIACARAGRGDGRWGGAVRAGRAGGEGWDIGAVRVGLGILIEGLLGEAGIEGLKGGLGVVAGNDVCGLAWALGLGCADG